MIGRYWLFAMWDYYPAGGMEDLYRTADTLEVAIASDERVLAHDRWHVVDVQERKKAELYKECRDGIYQLTLGVWTDIDN